MKQLQLIIFFDLLIGIQSGNFGTRNMKNWDLRIGTRKFFIQSLSTGTEDIFNCTCESV
jgi:hypothetical protein